ncbi:MAG: response regulator [Bdellovibrionia bacterium]
MAEIHPKLEVPLSTRILVVDDSEIMLTGMRTILSTLGFTDVVSARKGATAWNLILEQIEKQKPFEIILCDWNMPGYISGVQLLEKVRTATTHNSTIFILVTTENTFDKVKKAMDLGVSNYIIKPYAHTDVTLKLNSTWKKSKQAAA